MAQEKDDKKMSYQMQSPGMVQDKDSKKMTYQMKSPGDAWMDFVNSKEGHNAAAATPGYNMKEQNVQTNVDQRIAAKKEELSQQQQPAPDMNAGFNKQQQESKQQEQKNKGMDKGR